MTPNRPTHGGCPGVDGVIDFSSNLHPDPAPAQILDAAKLGVDKAGRYSEPDARDIRAEMAEQIGVDTDQTIVAPGSSHLLYAILSELKPAAAVIPTPCFSEYRHVCDMAGATIIEAHECPFDTEHRDVQPRRVPADAVSIMSDPCNPTGRVTRESIQRWLRATRAARGIMILDEAYADFAPDGAPQYRQEDFADESFIVIRSPLKFYSLPGLRAGVAMMSERLAGRVRTAMPPWPISAPAAEALRAATRLSNKDIRDRRRRVLNWADSFRRALRSVPGIRVLDSDTHFFLIRLPADGPDGSGLNRILADAPVPMCVRTSDGIPGLSAHDIRVSTRYPEENGKLVAALKKIYHGAPAGAGKSA